MRSRLTCRPAARAHSTTSGIRAGSWVRSRVASTCGTADCTPKLTRLKPAAGERRQAASSTESGFASVVTSAPGAMPQVRRTAPSIAARSLTGRMVGVPPPKNTVVAGAPPAPAPRARRGELELGDRLRRVVALLDPAQLGRRVGVEVAVAAAHPAERHVQVDPEVARGHALGDRVGEQPVGGRRVGDGKGARHPSIVRCRAARRTA